MDSKEIIRLQPNFASLWVDKEGIAHVKFKPNYGIDVQEVKDYLNRASKISSGNPKPVLMDFRDLSDISEFALGQLINPETAKLTKASAILTTNISLKMTFYLDFVLKLKKPPFPIKAFVNESDAITWLKQFVDKKSEQK